MSRAVTLIIVLSIWALFHLWVARRLILRGTEYPVWARRTIAGAVVAIYLVPILGFLGPRMGLFDAHRGALPWVAFVFMGVGTLLVALTIAVDVPRMIAQASLAVRRYLFERRKAEADEAAAASEAPSSMDRRRFFADVANYGIVGGAVGLSSVGFAAARRVPRVVEVDVAIADLHPDLEGLRIAQLSDVHVGPTIRGTWLDQVVEATNALAPDLVALTGDFVDGFVEQLGPELGGLGRLEATHGVFFVTGNHEYYWDGPAWCEHVASLGPTVLINEHRIVERGAARLLVAGVPDLHVERHVPELRSDPAAAKADAPAHDLSLLLAHQPRSIYAAAEAGFDLQLSGHTHAGQYFPGSLLIYLAQPYVRGLSRHGDSQIYVSAGTGYWGPPNRAGSPSEITLLRLVRA